MDTPILNRSKPGSLVILLCSFLLVNCPSITFAQNTISAFFLSQQTTDGGNSIMAFRYDYGTIEGTPYADNQWAKGSFLTDSGVIFTDVEMKFEAVSGLLAIRHNADSVYLRPSIVTEFQYHIDGQSHLYKNGFEAPSARVKKDDYLQVLHQGDWSIYKHVKKEFKEANFDPVFSTGNRFDSFQDANRYIVKSPDGSWSIFSPTRRNITRLFGSNSGDVNSFIRSNNLNLSNDGDLARVFEFASAQ